MARHRNVEWVLPDSLNNWELAGIAVLMDIRAELQYLNSLLRCPRFTNIPNDLFEMKKELRKVRLNTTKQRRKKKVVHA